MRAPQEFEQIFGRKSKQRMCNRKQPAGIKILNLYQALAGSRDGGL